MIGGVSDYSRSIAKALVEKGDTVHVWCPSGRADRGDLGVEVHPVLGAFRPRDLAKAGQELDRFASPRCLMVQWVPHGFGYKSMNLPFCLWLWKRARWNRDRVYLMIHEPYLPFKRTQWRQNCAAFVHRVMTAVLMNTAHHMWVSVPAWELRMRAYSLGRRVSIDWLPIVSSISTSGVDASETRKRYANKKDVLIGHFGTFSANAAALITPLISMLRHDSRCRFLFIGKGSHEFAGRLRSAEPNIDGSLHATGALSQRGLSEHIAACDLMVQPYEDGASSRRTSLMAAIAHGRPVVTNDGPHSEEIWKTSGAVLLAPRGNPKRLAELTEQLVGDAVLRSRLQAAAAKLYDEYFDIRHVIAAIRDVALKS